MPADAHDIEITRDQIIDVRVGRSGTTGGARAGGSAPPSASQPARSAWKSQLVVFAVGWALLLLMYALIAYTPLLKK